MHFSHRMRRQLITVTSSLNDYQKSLVGDEDAVYMKTMTYKAEDFVPVMACPSQVDKIRDVSELEGTTDRPGIYRFLYQRTSGGSYERQQRC